MSRHLGFTRESGFFFCVNVPLDKNFQKAVELRLKQLTANSNCGSRFFQVNFS